MRLHTPICDQLGIEYPIFAAGMGGVTLAPLTAVDVVVSGAPVRSEMADALRQFSGNFAHMMHWDTTA